MTNLDSHQQQAVKQIDGPVLVNAGPGSGKTRTLIARIRYLVDRGINPKNILVLTFTNKAAEEIRDRLKIQPPAKSQEPRATSKIFTGTVHSLCLKILTKEFTSSFTVINEFDQIDILKDIKSQSKLQGRIKKILSQISNFKNQSLKKLSKEVKNYYAKYQSFLKENNFLDYDDLLIQVLELLKQNEKVRDKYQNKFKYILVDEYQDINVLQDEIIKILAKPQDNLFVIGDGDQSIYGFRGANINLFLDFKKEFPKAKIITLINNYRSIPPIVKASHSLITHNKKRIQNKYKSVRKGNLQVTVVKCGNEKDEAKFISDEIEKTIGGTTLLHIDSNISDQTKEDTYNFADFAVLYRINLFSQFLEQEFLHKGIPYQIIGTNKLWQQKEIRDFLNDLKSLGDKKGLSGLIKKYKKLYVENDSNINKLINIINSINYSSLDELISKLALQSRETYIDKRANCVKLLTLHQTKGLEFKNVFIAGCEEEIVPMLKEKTELEEERRLLYVGMTRAQERLFLTYTQNRKVWGKVHKSKPSRFLDEIDDEFVEFKEFLKQRKKKDQMKIF